MDDWFKKKKGEQEWWPEYVAKGCLMISLDNEMHMSIVDVVQIKKTTTLCCVIIPSSTWFLVLTEIRKMSTKCLECHTWTDQEGESQLLLNNKTKKKNDRMNQSTAVHDYLRCTLPLMHPWHSNFHLRKTETWTKKPSPIIKVLWAQMKIIAEWSAANTKTFCWEHRRTTYLCQSTN